MPRAKVVKKPIDLPIEKDEPEIDAVNGKTKKRSEKKKGEEKSELKAEITEKRGAKRKAISDKTVENGSKPKKGREKKASNADIKEINCVSDIEVQLESSPAAELETIIEQKVKEKGSIRKPAIGRKNKKVDANQKDSVENVIKPKIVRGKKNFNEIKGESQNVDADLTEKKDKIKSPKNEKIKKTLDKKTKKTEDSVESGIKPKTGRRKINTVEEIKDSDESAAIKPKTVGKAKVTAKRGKEKEDQTDPEKVVLTASKNRKKKDTTEKITDSNKAEGHRSKKRVVKESLADVLETKNNENQTKKPVKKNNVEDTDSNKELTDAKTVKPSSSTSSVSKPAGRKRNVAKSEDVPDDNLKPSKAKKALLNPTETLYNKIDFELSTDSNTSNGNISNVERNPLKISSWNVAGLRSWVKKDGLKFLDYEDPDIFCMQETKCTTDQMPDEALRIPGYHPYWLCLTGGYAGVALYSKIMPINVEYGIGNSEFDQAGRLITAEYEKFYLINVYVPNSGRKLVNLEARMRWEKLFQEHVTKLNALKPIIICGDMNVSHTEIDLANPKSNTRSAGFTIEERDKMTELLALGYVDSFRHLYPNKLGCYTYWTYMANARSRNVGWRLDYFLVSERIVQRVLENAIRSQCKGSDHCPITLFINI